jgi:hypothetical protein
MGRRRDPRSVRAQRLAMIAPRPRLPRRYLVSRRRQFARLNQPEPPTAPRSARARRRRRVPTARPVAPRPTWPSGICRRSRRHPRLIRALVTPGRRPAQVTPELPESQERPGSRPPRPTSGARGPDRLVPRARGPAPRQARAVLRASVPLARVAPAAGPTSSRLRELGPGQRRHGPPDRVRPGRVRPGQAEPGLVPVDRVLARGQATTHSARPRPAWDRPLRPGPRGRARLVSRCIPAVPASRPALPVPPVVPAVLVRPDVDLAGPAARRMAVRVPAARVLAVPGRAR